MIRIRDSLRWKKVTKIEYNNIWYNVYDNIDVYISSHRDVKKIYKNNNNTIISNGYGKRYKRVTITCVDSLNNKIKLELLIHRIVAYSFLTKGLNDTDVNHKDGNPSNNYVSNLEWVTHKENVHHALKTGLTKTKLDENTVEIISKLLMHNKRDREISDIVSDFGYYCTPSIVFRIRNKDIYTRYTNTYNFPKNKPHKEKDPILGKLVYEMIDDGYSNKEIIDKLDLNDKFNNKNCINTYLYRHGLVFKELLQT